MILEALGVYSIYKWFTHRCDDSGSSDSNRPSQIGPNKHVLIPITAAEKAEVITTIWSPGHAIDACIVDAKNCDLFRAGKIYEVCGETESKDNDHFNKIKATLAPGTYCLLLINWNKATAEYWHTVNWEVPSTSNPEQ